MKFPLPPQPSHICLSHSYFQSDSELLVSWLRRNSKPCVGKILTLGDFARHAEEMVQKWWKQCFALPSLRKKFIPVYVTFVSMTMEDGGLLFLWPNFPCPWQDWGCITQAYNCYPGLLRRSFTSQVMPVVSVQPKLTNGATFSCSSGRLLPLHSTTSSVKKLPWFQASSSALPRAENPLVTFCLFQLLALWPSASYLTDLQSRLPWLYNSDDNTSLV